MTSKLSPIEEKILSIEEKALDEGYEAESTEAMHEVFDKAEEAIKSIKEQKCRVCGCTEDNCQQCIKLTGHPCHWVEPDLCSACQDAIIKPNNQNDMNFFQQLMQLGNVDMTMRIMSKNDKLTLSIEPGLKAANIQPIVVTGTPDELDAEFFTTIAPGVAEITGIVSNIDAIKKQAENKLEENKKAAAPKVDKKKEEPKPKKVEPKKEPEVESPLFD